MRSLLVSCLLALSACAPSTCVTTTSVTSASCSARDGGDAVVMVRPYSALDEVFVEGCQAAWSDAGLVVSATTRACPAGTSTGAAFAECTLARPPAGRYPLGAATLVVPADRGVMTCEASTP